MINKLVIN